MNQLRLELTPQTFSTEKRSKDYIQRDRREERGQRQTQAYSPLLLSVTSLLIFPVSTLNRASRSRSFYLFKPALTALSVDHDLSHIFIGFGNGSASAPATLVPQLPSPGTTA